MSPLIPCPFCGNADSLSPVWEGPYDWADGIWTGQMHCEQCGASGPIVSFMEQYEVDEKTSVAWNNRHESDEISEWLKDVIVNQICMTHTDGIFPNYNDGYINALNWVLSIRKGTK